MSKDKFKPISDALRKALQGLDVSDNQAKLQLLTSTTKQATATSKPLTVRQLNAKVLTTRAMTREEREAEAKRLAEAARPKWPDARVLFIEHTRCTGCNHESEGIAHPLIFLRLRHMLPGNKFDPTQVVYVPEKEYIESLDGFHLPRIIEHNTTQVATCPKCFTNAVHSFQGESIKSLQPGPDKPLTSSESECLSSLAQSTSLTRDEGKFGTLAFAMNEAARESSSLYTLSSGIDSPRPEYDPSAPAQPISSLITEERACAGTEVSASPPMNLHTQVN